MPSDELLDDLDQMDEDVADEEIGGDDSDGEAGDDAEPEAGEEPDDLASAFAALQRSRQDDADGDVGDGGDDSDDDGDEEEEDDDEALEDDRQDSDGGPGDGYAGTDYQALQDQLTSEIQQAAMQQAVAEYQRDGIRPITMNDLYKRDQSTGRVTYINPDDSSRPFSSRMEAQQWIDSFNSQLRQEIQTRARAVSRELSKQMAPARRLLAFAPTFDAMDAQTREVFDDLVEGFEVRNQQGDVVGYTCDLNRMAERARRMAEKYGRKGGGNVATKREEPRKPAEDLRSHGSASARRKDPNREPRDLNEAFEIMRERRRAGSQK